MTKLSNTLDNFLSEHGHKQGGVVLLCPNDAVIFIDMITKFGQKTHGVDGIFVRDNYRIPSMEHSLSTAIFFKSGRSITDIADEVKSFILQRRDIPHLLFEVVYSEF